MNLIQGSPEWLEARKSFVTATDAAVVMNLSPWMSPYSLWRQKMNLDPPQVQTPAMARGNELEPIARNWFINYTGIQCHPQVVIKDFMMASLDGLAESGDFVLEIKCGEKSYIQAKNGDIPDYYMCQMQHQMECSNVDHAMYVAFDGQTGIVMEVKRNQDFINMMIEKERAFYDCLIQFNPPEMDTKDYKTRCDKEWLDIADQYKIAYQELEMAEKREHELKQKLIHLAGSQNSMGSGIKLSKVPRRGAVEYSKIPNLNGVNLDEYRKSPIEYWKLTVSG